MPPFEEDDLIRLSTYKLPLLTRTKGRFMYASVMTSNGRITIPVEIRRRLSLKPGMKVVFFDVRGKLSFQPVNKNYIKNRAGILGISGNVLKREKKRNREL